MLPIMQGVVRKSEQKHLLMLLLSVSICGCVFGQDAQRVFMYLDYFQTDDLEYLVAELKYREEGTFYQLADAEVSFYQMNDTAQVALGSITTDIDGKARIDLTGKNILRDSAGQASFEARFAGDDSFRRASRDVTTIRSGLAILTDIEDSIKMVTITGEEKGQNRKAIEDADIILYVKRTFSDLPIAEGTLEEGKYVVAFPEDLPGDANGNLQLIARIVEHDDYGTVETQQKVGWGIPVSHQQGERPRALWSRPPIWIIVAVTLAFAAAWFHYFLAISKLLKIRKN